MKQNKVFYLHKASATIGTLIIESTCIMKLQCYKVRSQHDKTALLAFYHSEQEKINRHDLDHVYVLQQDEVIVGALKVEAIKQPECWFIRNVLVAEHARGQGLAKVLLEKTLLTLNDKPCFCLAYQRLVSLYEHCGFEKTAIESAADIFQKRFYRAQKKAITDQSKAVLLMVFHQGS